MAGAKNGVLILTNVNTGASQRITPGPDGSFSVALPPGTYRVDVERDGFRQTARQSLEIVSGSTAQLTVTLEGGPTIEAVEVKANAPAADPTPPEIGRAYTSNNVRALPVFDRNYQELVGLMTGVTPPTSSYPLTFDPQGTRQYATNGLPLFVNDPLADGVSVREPYTGNLLVRVIPDEAVQQLNVVTSNYPASSGFASGTLSNVYERPGTNGVHGSLFGFTTGDFFRTRDPFNVPGNPEPTLHDRQFGGTIGGAFIPDRLFFFGSYQGTIYNGSSLQFATVPTAAELGGNFAGAGVPLFNPNTGAASGAGRSPFATGVIPPSSISPIAAAYLSFLPAANVPGATANNLAQNVQFIDRGNVADGKVDYHFTDNVTGFLRYGWSSYNALQNSIFGPALGGSTRDTLRNHHASASLAGNYRGVIAEFRVGYSRYRNLISPNEQSAPLAARLSSLGFIPAGSSIVPSVSIEGLGTLGTPINTPAKDVDNNYEGEANFHIYRGKNQITFGADVRDVWSSGFPNFLFGPAGSFAFGPGAVSIPGGPIGAGTAATSSFASFLLGAPATSGIFSPLSQPSYRQRLYAGYLGDTVNLHHFTLTLGARYEVYSPVFLHGTNGGSVYNPATNSIAPTQQLGDYQLKNIEPRIGLAFPLTTHTVVRASYAINHFPIPFNLLPVNFTGIGTSNGVIGSFATTPFTVPSPAAAANNAAAANLPYFADSLTRTPYVQNYYLMIQQSAPWGFLLSAGYLGNITREMPFVRAINAAQPGTGLAGLPLAETGQTAPVFQVGNGLTSNYNSLQVNLTKRLSKGASFAVAYTWSKALDYGTVLQNPFNLRDNYGPADWDRTQMLTISHVFDIPIGQGTDRWNQGIAAKILGNWKINGIFHWATGTPYNVFADPLACACPGLPSVIATAAPGTNVNAQASFNPSSFLMPAPNAFGTLGRNAIRGPDFTNYNLSLFKTFPFAEDRQLELRAEAYNIINSTQFGNPYSYVSFGNFGLPNNNSLLNGLFGGGGRTFVLGARILF